MLEQCKRCGASQVRAGESCQRGQLTPPRRHEYVSTFTLPFSRWAKSLRRAFLDGWHSASGIPGSGEQSAAPGPLLKAFDRGVFEWHQMQTRKAN